MSVTVVLRAAPVATTAELTEPTLVRHHEMFDRAALRPLPGRDVRDIPILVDHRKDAPPIGRVTALRTEECWTGGTWYWIHAEITDPPAWLRKGTPVSISHSAFDKRTPWGRNGRSSRGRFSTRYRSSHPVGDPPTPWRR